MDSLLQYSLRNSKRPYITDMELATLWDGTPNSRYSKIKRLLAQGKLLHIRRGLYCLTEAIGYMSKPDPFALAQYIYGPSYISLESALSYHQLIPEAVYTTTSACIKRSKEFSTPLGIFSYSRLPLANFYTDVELITENIEPFFMAKPWKAICDYIYCYKKDWNSLDPLIKSLRIDPEDLPILGEQEVELLAEYYHHRRLNRFLKGITRELNL
jgi:hypothetical protein